MIQIAPGDQAMTTVAFHGFCIHSAAFTAGALSSCSNSEITYNIRPQRYDRQKEIASSIEKKRNKMPSWAERVFNGEISTT